MVHSTASLAHMSHSRGTYVLCISLSGAAAAAAAAGRCHKGEPEQAGHYSAGLSHVHPSGVVAVHECMHVSFFFFFPAAPVMHGNSYTHNNTLWVAETYQVGFLQLSAGTSGCWSSKQHARSPVPCEPLKCLLAYAGAARARRSPRGKEAKLDFRAST